MSDTDFFTIEENFHDQDRKVHKKERKSAEKRDRSQYKKSDQDQFKKQVVAPAASHLLRGRVIGIDPEGIVVVAEDKSWRCSLKGSLKQVKQRLKNLVAVGDFVGFEDLKNGQGIISHIEERFSILSRADNLSRNKEQLIAVNIDQVFITASVITPPLKPHLIDRYIIAAEKGNIRPIILINKIDLFGIPAFSPEEVTEAKALYEEFLQTYSALGIPVLSLSVQTGEGIDQLKEIMRDKTSVFSGQSGTGKSSLINALLGIDLQTGDVVHSTRKGSHTTTKTLYLPLPFGGVCIDTPGIKSFGLWDLQAADLAAYYSEITALSKDCRYANCTHLTEPSCAIRLAVEEGGISRLRFASYCALMASLSQEHEHR